MRHAASQWIAPLCPGAALLYCAVALTTFGLPVWCVGRLCPYCALLRLANVSSRLAPLCPCRTPIGFALPSPRHALLCHAIAVLRCPTLCHRLAKPRHALPTLRSTLPRNACAVRRLGWQCRCVSLPLLCVALRSPACASHLIALPCLSQAVLNHALPWPCRAAP